jgi:hypothetical protein
LPSCPLRFSAPLFLISPWATYQAPLFRGYGYPPGESSQSENKQKHVCKKTKRTKIRPRLSVGMATPLVKAAKVAKVIDSCLYSFVGFYFYILVHVFFLLHQHLFGL